MTTGEAGARRRLRVVVGEDDVLLREGIVRILTAEGLDVVAQSGDAEDLLLRALAHRPDVRDRRREDAAPRRGRRPTAYFVVAEALTNTVKHADARRARVQVELDGDALVVEVRDDGVGGADPARGTGLIGLLDRVDAAEGVLTITSRDGLGTTVRATLPSAPAVRAPGPRRGAVT